MMMRTTFRSAGAARTALLGALMAAAACAANAAPPASDAQARYEKDRAACLSGHSQQEQAACLKEAGAALEASKRLQDAPAADYRKNALIRCNALPPADRLACAERIDGNGTHSGTAAEGGILRESRMPDVGMPSAKAPSAP